MEKIKLEILGLSPSQHQSGSFALVLGESYGSRRLPIIIGMFEAQAIAIEIEKIRPNRPMTHDLFKSFAMSFNYDVREVVIADIREGVFFAKIVCNDGIHEATVDARPSDAIAIGLRFGVPIYCHRDVMNEASFEVSPNSDEHDEDISTTQKSSLPFNEQIKNMTNDELQQVLKTALNEEEYEKAAKIRDELSKRN